MTSTSSITTVSAFAPLPLRTLGPAPLVSILVGNYNYASYIGESIDSVLGQSYPHWELIICDDGSTDDSVSIIERYVQREERIRLLRKPNGGHTSALNAAFGVSRGEIICLLDSDDLYIPTKLERMAAVFAANSNSGFVAHRVIRINKQRQKQGVWPLSDSLPDGWLGPDILDAGGVLPYAPPTSGISLRREVAEVLFPLSTASPLHACPDQVIVRLAPLLTATKRMPDSLAEYRLHDANSYSRQQVTAVSVQRELDLSRALWKEQQRFLSCLYPDILERSSPLEKSSHTALLQYLIAKLRKQPDARKHRDSYLATCKGHRHWMWLLLWRLSLYFPGAVFKTMINAVLGQGPLKQWIARFKALL